MVDEVQGNGDQGRSKQDASTTAFTFTFTFVYCEFCCSELIFLVQVPVRLFAERPNLFYWENVFRQAVGISYGSILAEYTCW